MRKVETSLPFLKANKLWDRLSIKSNFSNLRSLTGLSAEHFDALYLPAIINFSERVQLSPASMSHHHAYEGGLLLHTLNVCEFALKMRQAYRLPLGAEPDEINELQHIYTYAMFAVSLLHDVGKALVNIRFVDPANTNRSWNPMGHSFDKAEFSNYMIEYVHPVPYKLHQRVSPTALAWLPDIGRNWLASHQNILGQVVAALYGDYLEASVFGEIIMKADGHSVKTDMKLDHRAKSSFAKPRVPIQEQILIALRQIFERKDIVLNKRGASGWVESSGEFIYVVCKSTADAILEQFQSEGNYSLPTDAVKIFDLMQDHNIAIPTSDDRAVWRVQITKGEFKHKFTCLKLETRRFFLPNQLPQPFDGEIEILATTDEHVDIDLAQPSTNESKPGASVEPSENLAQRQNPNNNSTVDDSTPAPSSSEDNFEQAFDNLTSGQEATESPEPSSAPTVLDFDDRGAGQFFLDWLIKGVNDGTLAVNQRTACLHVLPEGLGLVSPKIFETFCEQHTIKNSTEKPDFKIVQRRFQNMKLNIKTASGLNIHMYAVVNKENQKVADIKFWLIPLDKVYNPPATPPEVNDFIKKSP